MCRCGEREKLKSSKVESCTDVQGRNRTKCPCFVNGLGCKNCHCYNCKNIYGEKESSLEKNKDLPTGKRKSGLYNTIQYNTITLFKEGSAITCYSFLTYGPQKNR